MCEKPLSRLKFGNYLGFMAHNVRRYGGSTSKNKLASIGLIVAERDELVACVRL